MDGLLTQKQVAELAKVSTRTVSTYMRRGLPHIRSGGRVLFDPDQARAWLFKSERGSLLTERWRLLARALRASDELTQFMRRRPGLCFAWAMGTVPYITLGSRRVAFSPRDIEREFLRFAEPYPQDEDAA